MCGIVGMVSTRGSPLEAATLLKMTAALRHRGPDDEGYAVLDDRTGRMRSYAGAETAPELRAALPRLTAGERLGAIGLGHRRLAIVDVSAHGHQPMSDERAQCWIVFNGEIYNWRELRGELEALGHRFRSHTDTEVILNAYRQWGGSCVDRFNGEWAFGIVDLRARQLFLSRDRFGIKPLYVVDRPDVVAFASEPKALLAHPLIPAEADGESLWDYLVLGVSNHTPRTFFRDIRALEPGTHAVYDWGRPRWSTRRFYDLGAAMRQPIRRSSASPSFAELFRDAVRLRAIAEVPLGLAVSGGIDSASLCVTTRLVVPQPLDVFLAVSAQDTDDVRHAEQLIARSGFRAHRVELVPPSLDEFVRLSYAQDQPLQEWAGGVGHWQMHRQARRYVKACLEGHGADEYLLGYATYDGPYLLHLLARGRAAAMWRELWQLSRRYYGGSPLRLFAPLWRSALQGLPDGVKDLLDRMPQRYNRVSGRRLAAEGFAGPFRRANRPRPGRLQEPGSLDAAILHSLFVDRLPYFLHIADRNGMAHGVEVRVPFLDHRLVERVVTGDKTGLMRDGLRKMPLRDGMRGLLPEAIRTRVQKQGMRYFITNEWLRQHRDQALERVRGSALASRLIDVARLRAWLDRDDLRLAERRILWRAIHLALWQEAFGVGQSSPACARPAEPAPGALREEGEPALAATPGPPGG